MVAQTGPRSLIPRNHWQLARLLWLLPIRPFCTWELGMRGLYKLTNATAASPASVTVTRLNVSTANGCFDTPCTGNRNVNDMVFDPTDATSNTIILWQNGTPTAGDGGIFRTTNAMAATPSFT